VIELAVNDLYTQLKARQNRKCRSYLPLQCIRSIGHQTLSGLAYLHSKGFMHRDLKPQNILVTKWDTQTDIPTIKLGDFGIAGISSKAKTLCGTEGYIAPEIVRAKKRMEAFPDSLPPMYTNAIDIWALGKILKGLVGIVPSVRRGQAVPVNKTPALHLINRMMQDDPDLRPTAAECFQDPWMAIINNSESVLTQKRGRSPTPGPSSPTSSAGQPLRKVIRMALSNSIATEEGSTAAVIKAIWPSNPDGSS
jgi:serine/threonine protein kinase